MSVCAYQSAQCVCMCARNYIQLFNSQKMICLDAHALEHMLIYTCIHAFTCIHVYACIYIEYMLLYYTLSILLMERAQESNPNCKMDS